MISLDDLAPVAGSLHTLDCRPRPGMGRGRLGGTSAFCSMSQLTGLTLTCEHFENEEPWGMLGQLTTLRQLELRVGASGDPSPLSALTRLSSLVLNTLGREETRYSFSSLQPLSTLQQLERLCLMSDACAATSLQGLAVLSSLTLLEVKLPHRGGKLRSLEGITPGVVHLSVNCATSLVNLAGIEGCTHMEELHLLSCGVSSLQPLRCLSSLKQLAVSECYLASLEGFQSMSLKDLSLSGCRSLTHLSGVQHLTALTSLEVQGCGVTSLRPLSLLRQGLLKLRVHHCERVQETVLVLPHTSPTADVVVTCSNVKAVVLADGSSRAADTLLQDGDSNTNSA
jgi:internalin A